MKIGIDDLERDLVLPGTRLRGRMFRVDGGAFTDFGGGLVIGLRGDIDGWRRHRRARVDPDGTFAIDAVEPGEYLVNTHPLIVAGGVDSLRVEILPGEVEVVLDVAVRVP